jgi:hypothetical protein
MPLMILLLVAALAAPAALAQTLYKSTMPDGRVIYGDKPAPGAAKSEEQKPDTSKQGVVPPSAREKATAQSLEKDRLKRDAGAARIAAAEKAVRDAEAAQAAGKEPTAGDRQGTASGAQRLTDEYWARQKRLEQAVEQARANLEKVRAAK